MRQKNEKFAKDVRAGKQATHPSSRDKLAKRSPLGTFALGAIIFVVVGGCTFLISPPVPFRSPTYPHSILRAGPFDLPVTTCRICALFPLSYFQHAHCIRTPSPQNTYGDAESRFSTVPFQARFPLPELLNQPKSSKWDSKP